MEVLFSDFKQTNEFAHTHAQSEVTNLVTDLAGKASSTHNHDASYAVIGHNHAGVYSPVAHNHDASYSAIGHTHAGVYEPANANIQAHVASAHAPSNAQANADITKAEIEAKLTGSISSHSHAAPLFSSLLTFVGSTAGNVATAADVNPVSLTGLVFNFAANSKYRIWFMGLVQPAAATTGCGFQFDVSVAVTSVWVQFFHQLANTGTQSGGHSIADDASVGVSSGMPATSTYPVNGFGYISTAGNAGTAQLRFRSETTAVTTALAGFTLVVEKIA